MSALEADHWAWLLVLCFVFGCNVLRILLPSFSSFVSGVPAFQGPAGRDLRPRRAWRRYRGLTPGRLRAALGLQKRLGWALLRFKKEILK